MVRPGPRRVARLVFLGFCTTVGVAWLGFNIPLGVVTPWTRVLISDTGVAWRVNIRPGLASEVISLSIVPAEQGVPPNPSPRAGLMGLPEHIDGVPGWTDWKRHVIARAQQPGGIAPTASWAFSSAGWPLRCLKCGTYLPPGMNATADRWGQVGLTGMRGGVWLPFVPIWGGLVANTALFALLWGVPPWLVSRTRPRRRLRRGLCPRCAYNLRGDLAGGCPECGWNRTEADPTSGRGA